MKRIAIIGNGGGGKTTLSRLLKNTLQIPVYHVDSVQYQPGWNRTPQEKCDRQLDSIAMQDEWIIDGFGSKEVIERRLHAADTILFVDFPLWIHYWWALKRQIKSGSSPRKELPENCPEFSFSYTWRLFRILWRVHKDHIPWFRNLIDDLRESTTIFHLRSPKERKKFIQEHLKFHQSPQPAS